MEEALKKIIYTGVGLAATAGEKIQSTVQDLVEEGSKKIEDLIKDTEKEQQEAQLKNDLEKIATDFEGDNSADIETMNNTVKDLELKIEQYEQSSKKVKSS